LQADCILLDGELGERGEMNPARCAYQGIELADLAEHSTYGRGIVDIDLEIAGASADSDDIVAPGEFGRHGLADHATRTNMNDSHEALASLRLTRLTVPANGEAALPDLRRAFSMGCEHYLFRSRAVAPLEVPTAYRETSR
jgi:hypothetical protein